MASRRSIVWTLFFARVAVGIIAAVALFTLARWPWPAAIGLLLLPVIGFDIWWFRVRMRDGWGIRRPPEVTRERDGSLTFRQADDPSPGYEVMATRTLHEPIAQRRVIRVISLDVPDGLAVKRVEKAVARATNAATRALPGRGKVSARAAERDTPGPTSTLTVRLTIQGIGADESWGARAEAAFRDALMKRLS